MPFLDDGACIPSWLSVSDAVSEGSQTYEYSFNNTTLRKGYVVGVHYPLDENYTTAKEISYDVAVQASLGSEAKAWQVYHNCTLAIRLGGTEAEFTRMVLRTPSSAAAWDASKGLTQELLDETTCVYVECEDGRSDQARIVGFWEHPTTEADSKELGHYWKWKFNGIISEVNRDGEYSVTFTGSILDSATNKYAQPPENTTGTFLKFTKDGNFVVDDAKGESITLDKTNGKITILARAMETTTSEGDYNVTAKGKAVFKSDGNAVLNGAKNYVGSESATEPLVKGFELADALKKLIDAFLNNPLVGRAGSIPVFLEPSLRAQLTAWSNIYGRHAAPFLSKKGFVE